MESWATLLRTEVGVPNRSTTQPGVLGVSLLCKKIAFICPVGSLGCSEDKAHPIHSMMITFPLKIAHETRLSSQFVRQNLAISSRPPVLNISLDNHHL